MDLRIRTKPFSIVPNVLMFALAQMDLSKTESGVMFSAIAFIHYGHGGEQKTRLDCKKAVFVKNQRTAKGNVYKALDRLVERGILSLTVKARYHINHNLADWQDPDGATVFYPDSPAYERLVNLFQAQPWNGVQRIDPLSDGKYDSEQAKADRELADQYDEEQGAQADEEQATQGQKGLTRYPEADEEGITQYPNGFNVIPEKVSGDTQNEASGYQVTPKKVSGDTHLNPQTRTVKHFDEALNKQSCLRRLETTTKGDLALYVARYCKLPEGDLKNILRSAPNNLQAIFDLFTHLAALEGQDKTPQDNLVGWCVNYFRAYPAWKAPRARGIPTFAEYQTRQANHREHELQKRSKNANISGLEDSSSREGTGGAKVAANGSDIDALKHAAKEFLARSLSEQQEAEQLIKKLRRNRELEAVNQFLEQDRPDKDSNFFAAYNADLGRAEILYSNHLTALKLQEASNA